MKKPKFLKYSLTVLNLAFLLELAALAYGVAYKFTVPLALSATVYELLLAYLLYRLQKGSGWARLAVTGMIFLPNAEVLLMTKWTASVVDKGILAVMLLPVVPLALLWTSASSQWFAALRDPASAVPLESVAEAAVVVAPAEVTG